MKGIPFETRSCSSNWSSPNIKGGRKDICCCIFMVPISIAENFILRGETTCLWRKWNALLFIFQKNNCTVKHFFPFFFTSSFIEFLCIADSLKKPFTLSRKIELNELAFYCFPFGRHLYEKVSRKNIV